MKPRHHRQRATTAIGLWAAVILLASCGAARADLPTCDSATGRVRLALTVSGVKSDSGLIAVTIYPDDPRRFLVHKGQIGILRTPAHAPLTRVCVALPEVGTYAAVVYHDANANHRFDRSAIGLPAEGYGFSNNPSTFMGVPSFRAVRFKTQAGDNALAIRLIYPRD